MYRAAISLTLDQYEDTLMAMDRSANRLKSKPDHPEIQGKINEVRKSFDGLVKEMESGIELSVCRSRLMQLGDQIGKTRLELRRMTGVKSFGKVTR